MVILNNIKLTSRWRFGNFLSKLSQLQSIESLTSPQVYKQDSPLVPEVMRDHQSHDVLLMCVNCHQDSNHHDFGLRKELEVECDAPIGTADDVKVCQ